MSGLTKQCGAAFLLYLCFYLFCGCGCNRCMIERNSDLVQHRLMLHLAVVLFGFTAILGKLITVNAITLVSGGWFSPWFYFDIAIGLWSTFASLSKRDKYVFLTIGFLLAFTGFVLCSCKMAHVSSCPDLYGAYPMFTSLIEPWSNVKRLKKADLIFHCLWFL